MAAYLRDALVELEVQHSAIDDVFELISALREQAVGETADAAAPGAEGPAGKAKAASRSEQSGQTSVASQSVRITVDLLENLMTMVSELVLSRNQLLQILRKYEESEFAAPLQRLSLVTTDLQEGVMKTRMQPIGNAWSKLPRIVRDLSHELDKKIELEMFGAETELDRQVLEMIKDPLTHMVRNSADHGVETVKERAVAGKPETGHITLNAYHEGGHIIIEISDDGRGINVEKVRAKAVANGLATEAELDAMSEKQIQQFIFKAGFSTAEKVTNVSGRGVGMDVVRSNIERIGGHVELKSVTGKGSTFVVKIPLTLAIVSALIVECAGERFAIPQISVDELVRVSPNSEHRLETINDTPVLRLRNRLLPLVELNELLKLGGAPAPAGQAEDDGAEARSETFIVVARVGTYSVGIVVDRVFESEEIVVKPVTPVLREISIFSGNTILGDGSVIMILDPNGIAQATGEVLAAETMHHGGKGRDSRDARGSDRTPMLVFRAGGDEPKAVPLALVARLEEIDRTTIEESNGTPVVQYRGQLMPLIAVDPAFRLEEEGRQHVVVFQDSDRSMGVMVDAIVDIVEDRLKVEIESAREGVLGTAVIAGKATDVIDTAHYLRRAFGDWFQKAPRPSSNGGVSANRVLLVDDSPFFRNLLTPLLSVAGYEVTAVQGGEAALGLRESGHDFDVIISDIEMPGMNGFDLARAIKQDGAWKDTPIVALSSYASKADLEKGRAVGFDDYVVKLDREALLQSLTQSLSAHRGAA
ncbi:MAG: response regulator [Alphaproteobacteria bacterium]|nr:response regulator [Alphaproteobacteria bacterium]